MRIVLAAVLVIVLLLIVFNVQANCVRPSNYPKHAIWADHPVGHDQVYYSFYRAVTVSAECIEPFANGDDYCRLRWIGNMRHYLLAKEAGVRVYTPTYAVLCLIPWY